MEEIKHHVLLLSIYIPAFWTIALLFTDIRKNPARRYVFFLFLNITFVYFMAYLRYSGKFYLYSALFPIQASAVLLSFPFFYFYVSSITNIRKLTNYQHLRHLLLSIFFGVLFLFILYFFMDGEQRYFFISEYIFNPSENKQIFETGYFFYKYGKLLYVGQSFFYFYLLIRLYKQHNRKIEERFSSTEEIDLSWMKSIGIIFVLVIIFNALLHLLKLNTIMHNNTVVVISYTFFNLFFLVLGIFVFRQKEVYGLKEGSIELMDYDKTVFKLTKNEILQYMDKEKPYRKKDFTIYDMCLYFNTNRTDTSSFINQCFEMNFKSLVNFYRIMDAKELIQQMVLEKKDIPLEIIAMEAGFQSYATFVKAFKQAESLSPDEFREKRK